MKSILACVALVSASTLCQAGESVSSTFYAGEDTALHNATVAAIHYNHYAQLTSSQPAAPKAQGIKALMIQALTPQSLNRPVYERGLQLNTLSSKDGMSLKLAYRF